MRQRILLVAGWVAAAVVTSLVASGAVAVAGGQVADRPLRPLSASEVAALPVVLTEGGEVPCRPLASGGFDRDTGATPDSAGSRNDGGSSAGGAISSPEGDEIAAVQTQVVSVRGGSVNVAAEEGGMDLLWAIARPGFSVDHGVDEDGTLRVTFSCEDLDSVVETWWDVDLECTFTFTGSEEIDGPITTHEWDFGEGTTATGPSAINVFDSVGAVVVTLTITDDQGSSVTNRHVVRVSETETEVTNPSFTWTCGEVGAIAIDTFEDAQ